jgi:protein gp37
LALNSSIEWTEATWNPVTGCDKVSPGCKFCYAERMAFRLQAMGQPRYRNGFEVTLQEDVVELPLRWREPKVIFVNSMSDLFHKDIPAAFILRCFETMQRASQHTFQVLTKRPERALELSASLPWPANLWLGTSVENANYVSRIHELQKVPAKIRFLSVEPLLGPIPRLPVTGISWVIVGGESGPGARPMDPAWARQIRDRCLTYDVPFFFKQWGGVQKSRTGRILDGRTWDEYPISTARDTPHGKEERQLAATM